MDNKRGLSPIIATVLLIALVLILILIIFLWARGFISERIEKGGQSIDSACDLVSFEVSHQQSSLFLNLQIVNRGNVPINNFEVRAVRGGNSDLNNYPTAIDVGESGEFSVSLPSGTNSVIVYPVILGSVSGKSTNKQYTCLENGKRIDL